MRGREGTLFRTEFNGNKIDLLLVTKQDWQHLKTFSDDVWPKLEAELYQDLLQLKLLAFIKGGHFYSNCKTAIYHELLPDLSKWFAVKQAGEMCTSYNEMQSEDSQMCFKRHDKDDMFCTEHRKEYDELFNNFIISQGQNKPPRIKVSKDWLATAPLTGKLITLSGASGVGKSTIAKVIHKKFDGEFARSITTRKIREKETPNKDYYFLGNSQAFETAKQAGLFFESSTQYGNQYGKCHADLLPKLLQGKTLAIDLHADTVHHYQSQLPHTYNIYLIPPKHQALVERFKLLRNDCSEEENQIRLDASKREHQKLLHEPTHRQLFNAVFISGNGAGAALDTKRIIKECLDAVTPTLRGKQPSEQHKTRVLSITTKNLETLRKRTTHSSQRSMLTQFFDSNAPRQDENHYEENAVAARA